MPPLSYTSISTLSTIALITSLLVELVSAVKIIFLIHYLTNAYIVIGYFHQLMTCLSSVLGTKAIPQRERALLCLLFQVSPYLLSYNTSNQATYLPPVEVSAEQDNGAPVKVPTCTHTACMYKYPMLPVTSLCTVHNIY